MTDGQITRFKVEVSRSSGNTGPNGDLTAFNIAVLSDTPVIQGQITNFTAPVLYTADSGMNMAGYTVDVLREIVLNSDVLNYRELAKYYLEVSRDSYSLLNSGNISNYSIEIVRYGDNTLSNDITRYSIEALIETQPISGSYTPITPSPPPGIDGVLLAQYYIDIQYIPDVSTVNLSDYHVDLLVGASEETKLAINYVEMLNSVPTEISIADYYIEMLMAIDERRPQLINAI